MTGGSRDTENHVISSLQGPPPKKKKKKKAFLGHFRSSDGYAYLTMSIVNSFLQSFLGVNQLYTTCGSRNMENHAISTL